MLLIPKAHNLNSNWKQYAEWCESEKNRGMTYGEIKAYIYDNIRPKCCLQWVFSKEAPKYIIDLY